MQNSLRRWNWCTEWVPEDEALRSSVYEHFAPGVERMFDATVKRGY